MQKHPERQDAEEQAEGNDRRPAAGERMKAYEMGESGQVVLLWMTPEEMAVEDAKATRLAALRESGSKKSMLVTYEMAESGEVIGFPMSAEAIKTAERLPGN